MVNLWWSAVIFCWLAGYFPFIAKNSGIKLSSWLGMLARKLLLDVPTTSEKWIFHEISPLFACNTLTWHVLQRSTPGRKTPMWWLTIILPLNIAIWISLDPFGGISNFQTRRWITLSRLDIPCTSPWNCTAIASPWWLGKRAKSQLNPSKSDQIHEKSPASPASPFFLGPGLSLFPGLQGASQQWHDETRWGTTFWGFKWLSQDAWWFNQRSCALNATLLQECGDLTSFQ